MQDAAGSSGGALRKTSLLGSLLIARGALSPERLNDALSAQRESQARIGEIVARRGWSAPDEVAAAAAQQVNLERADLVRTPLDPALITPEMLDACLAHGIAPWRRDGDRVIFVAADAETALRGMAALGLPPDPRAVALSDAASIAAALTRAHGALLGDRAAGRVPAALSVRAPDAAQRGVLALCGLALAGFAALSPAAAFAAVLMALLLCNLLNAGLRIAALNRALRPSPDAVAAPTPDGALSLSARRPPPRVSLLIPLYDEPDTLPVLIDALNRLDWPKELLDVKLILEADDDRTRAALDALGAPPFCDVLVAPPDGPRTKPKALNYALDFADGDIVGVYDAEDRPEPDQLRRVAAILRAAPPEVACVQARLSYYNARENWLTRCFAIEYAIWFDVLLGGYRDLRLPIPLGGTSVFFRRAALIDLGGWDAHNVTEDADLGMRLARRGFRCEVTASTTHEEAASRPWQWMRQRSRWLKGYMATWLTHMRRPVRLLREMGLRGFVGFQAIFLGAFAAYLGLPLFWLLWGLSLAGAGPDWLAQTPGWVIAAVASVQLAGWGAMLVAAFAATGRRGERWLWPWIPTLLFYWPLGAVSAWMALVELALAPTLWRKTRHGLGRAAAAERAAAMDRLESPPQPAARRAAR